MSDEELRDHINIIAQKIVEIEDAAKKKLEYVKNRLSEDFNLKINEIEAKLESNRFILVEINEKINGLNLKKNEIEPIIKNLEKERKQLRSHKEKSIKEKIKAISDEKKNKMKSINKEIKSLEKELKKPKE